MREGEMAIRDGRLVRIVEINRDFEQAWICRVMPDGTIRQQIALLEELTPLHIAMGTRSLWPELNRTDQIELSYLNSNDPIHPDDEGRGTALAEQKERRAKKKKRTLLGDRYADFELNAKHRLGVALDETKFLAVRKKRIAVRA